MKISTNLLKPKIRKINVYESKGYGAEPIWKDVDSIADQDYVRKTVQAANWYLQFFSKKECQDWAVAWLHNNYPKRRADAKLLGSAKPDSISNLLCVVYALQQQGWKPRVAVMRHLVKDLKKAIANGRERKVGLDKEAESVKAKNLAPQPTIQEKVKEQAGAMSEELDYAIDSWIMDPDKFDPKAFKVINLLRNKGVKPAHAREIKSYFKFGYDELIELSSGKADDQLREAYSHVPRKNIRKLIEFYESINTACEQIVAEAKVLKKPRPKKIKPVEELVKKVKFLATDDKLGIASVSPTHLIGSQSVVVFNVKTRKLGYYVANSSTGIAVKNSSLDNFSEKSIQKTLRKPVEQLKSMKEQNTQRRFENWFTKEITTMDTPLNGRLNEDTLIIKVFK